GDISLSRRCDTPFSMRWLEKRRRASSLEGRCRLLFYGGDAEPAQPACAPSRDFHQASRGEGVKECGKKNSGWRFCWYCPPFWRWRSSFTGLSGGRELSPSRNGIPSSPIGPGRG